MLITHHISAFLNCFMRHILDIHVWFLVHACLCLCLYVYIRERERGRGNRNCHLWFAMRMKKLTFSPILRHFIEKYEKNSDSFKDMGINKPIWRQTICKSCSCFFMCYKKKSKIFINMKSLKSHFESYSNLKITFCNIETISRKTYNKISRWTYDRIQLFIFH